MQNGKILKALLKMDRARRLLPLFGILQQDLLLPGGVHRRFVRSVRCLLSTVGTCQGLVDCHRRSMLIVKHVKEEATRMLASAHLL